MIETEYPTSTFEDAVQATAYIARVDVTHGELRLPTRVREHLADGDVVVHLVRGGDDVAVYTAQLTATSKLLGIEWPADVTAGTSLTVVCPRGGASHDIGVLLPDLPEEPRHLVEPEPVAEPEPDVVVTGRKLGDPTAAEWRAALAAATAEREAESAAEIELPGPAEYRVPSPHPRTEQPTEPIDPPVTGELELPTWPGDDDLAPAETTEVLPAVLVPAAPDLVEDDDPRTVFAATVVAVRSRALVAKQEPPRRAGWLERRLRLAARLVLDHSWTATRIAVAAASGLVLAGAGLGYVVTAVFQ